MKKSIVVVGGGIIGLSTAMHLLQRFPDVHVTLIEKENDLAQHQTSHNSGVIHAGVYYEPGSLKAQYCRDGSHATIDFCRQHDIAFDQCGKLIVASDDKDLARLAAIHARCRVNGLAPELLGQAQLREREPRISGRGAIFVAASGIVDYSAVARTMARVIEAHGGKILTGEAVRAIREENGAVTVETTAQTLRADGLVACAGLHADRLAALCGIETDFKIVPFRGEYFRLPAAKNDIVKHLIYPVPDPALPFLGVHLTRMIDGSVTVGPNAVLALSREGYGWRNVSLPDMAEMLAFPGFWKMLKKQRHSAIREFRNSVLQRGYLQECRKYCPELTLADLQPHPSGVRAQAMLKDGTLAHDFMIRSTARTLHVCNAPSPAATSSIPIGRHLVDRLTQTFGWT